MVLTLAFISEQTMFDCGAKFESEQAVRDYFTPAMMRELYGDHCDTDEKSLERMADMVVANRWHCDFGKQSEMDAQMSFLKRSRLVSITQAVQPTSASPVQWVTLPIPITGWARLGNTCYVVSWEGWMETNEASIQRASEAGVKREVYPYAF